MVYTNENKNAQKTENVDLMLESQYGLMLYNNILGYNNKNENVETIDTETVYGSLDIKSSSKDAKLQTALINNYEQEIQNIVLTGDIPTSDNENGFNAKLNSINTNNSNAKIYYTNNKNVAIDDSSWTENNNGAVKYKIVIDKMEPQERLAIETGLNIPGDLKYNVQGDLDTNVTYSVNSVEQKNSSKIVLKTEEENNEELANEITTKQGSTETSTEKTVENENIKVDITATVGEDALADKADIKERETVKYTIKLTNNTSSTQYTEVKSSWYEITDKNEINLGKINTLKNGESVEFSYKAVTYMLNDSKIDGSDMYGTIYLASEDGSINQNVTTGKNTIKSANLQIILKNTSNESYQWLEGGNCIASLVVNNLKNEDLNNVKIQVKLSKELSDNIKLENFKNKV